MMQKHSKLFKALVYTCAVLLVVVGITNLLAMMEYLNRHGTLLPGWENAPDAIITRPPDFQPSLTPSIPDGNAIPFDPGASDSAPAPVASPNKNVFISGFKTLAVQADSNDISVDFYNPSDNEGEYLMTFEMLLPTQTGSYESVYSSGIVEAGKHIRNISLSHPIPRGTYERCILRVQPYYVEDRAPANTAEVNFTLYAQ